MHVKFSVANCDHRAVCAPRGMGRGRCRDSRALFSGLSAMLRLSCSFTLASLAFIWFSAALAKRTVVCSRFAWPICPITRSVTTLSWRNSGRQCNHMVSCQDTLPTHSMAVDGTDGAKHDKDSVLTLRDLGGGGGGGRGMPWPRRPFPVFSLAYPVELHIRPP